MHQDAGRRVTVGGREEEARLVHHHLEDVADSPDLRGGSPKSRPAATKTARGEGGGRAAGIRNETASEAMVRTGRPAGT